MNISIRYWLQNNIFPIAVSSVILALVLLATFHMPLGYGKLQRGNILSKTQLLGSKFSPNIIARVQLETGKIIDISLPNDVYLKINQQIYVKQRPLLISKSLYHSYYDVVKD